MNNNDPTDRPMNRPSRSLRDVPWQIWIVVALLALEGMSNLLQMADEPRAIYWFLWKCLCVVGLIKGWKVVFWLFQAMGALHMLVFLVPAPVVAIINLLVIGLVASAFRFYFPAAAAPENT